jgi:predicted permease
MGIGHFWRRDDWDRERREEIESYIRLETDDNLARGMSERDAEAAARRKFGNASLVREEIYRMNTIGWLEAVAREARQAVRGLRRNPGFAVAALVTLGIGIGASTAVFSVVDGVLLKPLRYPRSEEVVALRQEAPGAPGLADVSDGLRLSTSMYFTYADHNRSFQSLGVWRAEMAGVTGLAEPEQVRIGIVSGGVLETLAVPPVAGRWFRDTDQTPGGHETAMLSYDYWQRRFGGDRSALGRNIRVDGRPREIAGVMPRGFRLADTDFELLLPLAADRGKAILAGFGFAGVARLRPGVSLAAANADLKRLVPVWMDSWTNGPGSNPHIYEKWRITPAIRPLKEEVIGNVRDVLWAVMGTVALLMVIAGANVMNLMLVRAESRRAELALRSALGAGTSQVARGLMVESAVLGVAGGAVGVVLAYAGIAALVAAGPAELPRLSEVAVDGRVLAFSVALALIAGLIFGVVPALKYAGGRVAETLRGAGRAAGVSRESQRTRHLLASGQMALALVLLVGAGLLIRSFDAMRRVAPGFTHPESIQLARISIPESLIAEPQDVLRTERTILDGVSAIPGVTAAGMVSAMPMEGIGGDWDAVQVQGRPPDSDRMPAMRMFKTATPGWLRACGTRLVAGRDLDWQDIQSKRLTVLVSDNLARELWGSAQAAIGRRIATWRPGAAWAEVVGVVENVRENGVVEQAPAAVYWPVYGTGLYGAGPAVARDVVIAMRTQRAGTESLAAEISQAVWRVNRSLPVASVRTEREVVARSQARTSFTLVTLGIAGAMALVLGVVGIYGVVAYAVGQRRREVGIRLALGAQKSELLRMFLGEGLWIAVGGGVAGIAASLGAVGVLRGLLFGVTPLDPVTYSVAVAVLVGAALLASYVPARRAAEVDPAETLRSE